MAAKQVRLPSSTEIMDPAEFEAAKAQLGASDAQLARALHLGRDYDGGGDNAASAGGRTVRRWRDGEREIPGPVATLLRLAVHSAFVREALALVHPPASDD